MPEPARLVRVVSGGQCVVSVGRVLVYSYDADDVGMRNLAIVALTDAGRGVGEVAEVFGLTATYVSMLRGRARAAGSAGLVRRRGRPPKLTERQVAKARRWAGEGVTQTEIARRLPVSRWAISDLLTRLGPVQEPLTAPTEQPALTEPAVPGPAAREALVGEPVVPVAALPAGSAPAEVDSVEVVSRVVAGADGLARIAIGAYPSRYAGAGLLHTYLDRVGATDIFATLTGAPYRDFDDVAILATATVGFALGIDTVEGAKQLRRREAGPVLGVDTIPELRTLRPRLAALADGADPLTVQRAFAKGTLAADPPTSHVYFVDDHFVPYTGARPVAKGYNTKRRLAEPGRADTPIIDERGRAVVFTAGEPSGLTRSLPVTLAELRDVVGPDAPILLGFDRGGAFPVVFKACRAAGVDWVSYRRGKLAPISATPKWSWTIRDGRRVSIRLADEMVTVNGYGPARQLTLFEGGTAVLQVLTSDTRSVGAALVCWLRARWRIENMLKYAAEHNGIDKIASYDMDIVADTRKVANPARLAARKNLTAAEVALTAAQRALAQVLTTRDISVNQVNAAIPKLQHDVTRATTALDTARAALKTIPAKLPATTLDPDAKRATPLLRRRGLQMVLRLLAYNAEAWLAEHLNAYLADPDEYRATLRNLLRLGGHITYTHRNVTVTLDRPDTPRIARALEHLVAELNTSPSHIPGDRRPLTYQVTPA